MTESKLKVISVVEALCNALSEAIFHLEYAPGQQITEAELCARFDVSRNTVHVATSRLITCGLLDKEANKGVFVKEVKENDFREVFHFRALLESEAMRFIIRNGRNIPQELRSSMESIEFDPHIQKDWYRSVSSDLNFHLELVRASESLRLLRLYDTIRLEIMLSLCQNKNSFFISPKNIYEHRQFIDVLESGTEEEAGALAMNHIIFGVEGLAKGFHDKQNVIEALF